MYNNWKVTSVVLAAGMLLGCDRAERNRVDRPEDAAQELRTDLPPVAPDSPEPRVAEPSPKQADSAPQMAPAIQLDPRPSSWELQLAERTSRLKPTDRARVIFAMIPTLPPQALASAAEQAVEKLPDADYPATALPVVTNPETHGQVLSVLFADLLERPDAITLPALLTIAKNPDHPFAPSALDDLRLLLNADYGSDWSRWDAAIRQKLATVR